MLFRKISLKILLLIAALQFLPVEAFEVVHTEQEASTLSAGRLIVQLITEPESLIRWFEGWNVFFQMMRHWGRTGSALLRVPFDGDILNPEQDYIGLDPWKRPYYARMPKRFPAEAPRYVRLEHARSDEMNYRAAKRADDATNIPLNIPNALIL